MKRWYFMSMRRILFLCGNAYVSFERYCREKAEPSSLVSVGKRKIAAEELTITSELDCIVKEELCELCSQRKAEFSNKRNEVYEQQNESSVSTPRDRHHRLTSFSAESQRVGSFCEEKTCFNIPTGSCSSRRTTNKVRLDGWSPGEQALCTDNENFDMRLDFLSWARTRRRRRVPALHKCAICRASPSSLAWKLKKRFPQRCVQKRVARKVTRQEKVLFITQVWLRNTFSRCIKQMKDLNILYVFVWMSNFSYLPVIFNTVTPVVTKAQEKLILRKPCRRICKHLGDICPTICS